MKLVEDALHDWNTVRVLSSSIACVHVAGKGREVAAGNVNADVVPFPNKSLHYFVVEFHWRKTQDLVANPELIKFIH